MKDNDNKYINSKVYDRIAHTHKVTSSAVEQIMMFVGEIMAETIVEGNPNVSVKLDYIGNLYSNPARNKVITIRRENKENGRFTDN